jgi:uncharacterized Zn finger protein (UPF0148 family)
MVETGYKCKECGAPVVIADGKVIRSCNHKDAVVVASMTATATGEGKAEQRS